MEEDLIFINCGGQRYFVKRSVLTAVPSSMLAAMFRPDQLMMPTSKQDDLGAYVIEQPSPDVFSLILEYLKTGTSSFRNFLKFLLPNLLAAADYYGLEELAECL